MRWDCTHNALLHITMSSNATSSTCQPGKPHLGGLSLVSTTDNSRVTSREMSCNTCGAHLDDDEVDEFIEAEKKRAKAEKDGYVLVQ